MATQSTFFQALMGTRCQQSTDESDNTKKISAPKAIKRYNKAMQGVDRFDHLMSLYSLASCHPFKKWYKKMAMAIFDFGLTNAEIHCFMANPGEKKKK